MSVLYIFASAILIVPLLKLALHSEFLRTMKYIINNMQLFSSLDGLQNWFAALTMGAMTAHVAVWMIVVLYLPTLLLFFSFFSSHYLKYEIKIYQGTFVLISLVSSFTQTQTSKPMGIFRSTVLKITTLSFNDISDTYQFMS